MQFLFEPGNEASHEYPDQYFYLGISWKNHGFLLQ